MRLRSQMVRFIESDDDDGVARSGDERTNHIDHCSNQGLDVKDSSRFEVVLRVKIKTFWV